MTGDGEQAPPIMWAYVNDQGTAMASTALCDKCFGEGGNADTAHALACEEADYDGGYPHDCSGNDELSCVFCGISARAQTDSPETTSSEVLSVAEGLGVRVTITSSAGTDGAIVVLVDTEFEPDGSDGGPGLRVLINDDDTYIGVPYGDKDDEPRCGTCDMALLPNGDCPLNGQHGDEAPEHVAVDLIDLKREGGDCTADESAWIMGFFDLYHPDTERGGALALAYPLERDQWFEEIDRGDRPNDTGRALLARRAQVDGSETAK